MNGPMQLPQETPRETAARFVARLCAGELTEEDQRAMEEWLAKDPRHLVEYEAMLGTWDALGTLNPDDLASSPREPVPRRATAVVRRNSIAAAVALCALIAGAAFVSWYGSQPANHAVNVHETQTGQREVVQLQDGSSVTLNTRTRLLVDFSNGRRRLVLVFGEAYFDIARNPSAPLTVEVGDRLISVLGTAFNVYSTDTTVAVAVIRGLVSVDRLAAADREARVVEPAQTHAVLLREGSGATFPTGASALAPLSPQAVERSLDWRLGIVKFDNEPLSAVIEELNRYSDSKIVIADADLGNIPVSGVFRLDNTDRILQGMESAMPVSITRQADRYVMVRRDAGTGDTARDRDDRIN